MPAEMLDMPGVIVSGHPNRHVRRVATQGSVAYLKVEHRIPRRDRWENWRAGFGWVSKSHREALLLCELADAGLSAPRCLAHGEHTGRAFVLIAGEDATTPTPWAVGQHLRELHAAGFWHPDTDARHFLAVGERVVLLDWQRGRRGRVSEADVVRALGRYAATGHADIGELLAGYDGAVSRRAVEQQASRLLQRGRRLNSTPGPAQELVWLAGEAIVARPSVAAMVSVAELEALAYGSGLSGRAGGVSPLFLPAVDSLTPTEKKQGAHAPRSPRTQIRRRSAYPFAGRAWAWLRDRPWRSPEVREAGVLFQRERRGIPCPRLLAFGQRFAGGGRVDSFLLTELPEGER